MYCCFILVVFLWNMVGRWSITKSRIAPQFAPSQASQSTKQVSSLLFSNIVQDMLIFLRKLVGVQLEHWFATDSWASSILMSFNDFCIGPHNNGDSKCYPGAVLWIWIIWVLWEYSVHEFYPMLLLCAKTLCAKNCVGVLMTFLPDDTKLKRHDELSGPMALS